MDFRLNPAAQHFLSVNVRHPINVFLLFGFPNISKEEPQKRTPNTVSQFQVLNDPEAVSEHAESLQRLGGRAFRKVLGCRIYGLRA